MGDTIYSDTEVPGYTLSDIAITVAQKWAAYQTNLAMKPWAKARGSAAYYAHWDDHEFINDFSPAGGLLPLRRPGQHQHRRREALQADGVRAFIDYNPVTYSEQNGIYRSVRWGKNLEVFFLDERSFRSASLRLPGRLRQPARQRQPGPGADRAAEHPPGLRAARPAVQQPAAARPAWSRSTIRAGRCSARAQLAKFKQAITKSNATFKVIFNEVPIQQFYANPYDRWEGYEAERKALLALPARQRQERRLPDHRRPRATSSTTPASTRSATPASRTPGSWTSPRARSRPRRSPTRSAARSAIRTAARWSTTRSSSRSRPTASGCPARRWTSTATPRSRSRRAR